MTTLKDVDPKKNIIIKGAKLHNLKNIDVIIPRNKLVVVTGLSGSGKSSLAFDTLYAEGQRRYVESLSSYARQFLGKLDKPKVDYIKGIAPAIAIEQKVNSTNPRSTVGTTTEIYDYLKLLFARIGNTISPVSGNEVKKQTVTDVVNYVKTFDEGAKLLLLSPIKIKDDRDALKSLELFSKQGYARIKYELDGMKFLEPNVHLFSFNNPYGACPKCEGYGDVIGIDPDLVVPNTALSVYENAIFPWRGESMGWYRDQLVNSAYKFDFPIHKPWFELSTEQKQLVWKGNEHFIGIHKFFEQLEEKSYKIQNRVMLSRYRGKTKCSQCHGKRLREEANYVKVQGKSISDLIELPIKELVDFFGNLQLSEYDGKIAKRLLKEITTRLDFLDKVGLNYLTLNRKSNTLSGGESQRINLATSLGSSLVGSMYILDEPSIGLHPKDTENLIEVLKSLRDLGNTVIVVEHDEDIMKAADEIIDIGGEKAGQFTKLEGKYSQIKSVEFVDQNPIGRSSRSNPVTYIKAYDDIRALFASQKLSKLRGYQAKHFSFNVDGGRCEKCKGEGEITVEMQFMADVHLECDVCEGKRFKKEVLEVKFEGKSISDVLNLTIDNAIAHFQKYEQKRIVQKLKPLQDVGLGYVTLGQSSSTLSGGEAQRIKLASFLVKGTSADKTLFIFDEPTTGLHFDDIKKLLKSFDELLAKGHSIIVIEHNIELIKCADYIIDLGPEGGENGGNLLAEGTPEEIVQSKESFTAVYLREKI